MANSPNGTLTPIDDALQLLLSSMDAIAESETVTLDNALNRVLSQSISAPIAVPGYDNSAMDGYAVNSQDILRGQTQFLVSQRIPAGSVGEALLPQTLARIFTGAPVPEGSDAVIMQENCRIDGDLLIVEQGVKAGENIRRAGADVEKGAPLFAAGQRLRGPDIGMLAGVGIDTVKVRRPLRVAVLTTGDELIRPGQPLKAGQIYNSNFYTVSSLLRNLGHEVIDCGIVEDTLEATESALRNAANKADCIISSGGVSVGEEDHVRHALERSGELNFWKLAIKPGKPFAFGRVENTPFFGLPGNPVSAFINFALIVRPCLNRLQGVRDVPAIPWHLAADFKYGPTGVRQEYLRVRCVRKDQQNVQLQLTGNQSSGVLSSISACDGLAIIPPKTSVLPGDLLRFLPLSEIVGQV